jgi:serine/threonine protein kinase/WD40 repeat protein
MNAQAQTDVRRCSVCGGVLSVSVDGNTCARCALGEALAETKLESCAEFDGPILLSLDEDPGRAQRFGDYELLEEIDRGGMGVVYKARQISLDRLVALKMVLFGRLGSEEYIQRFRVEASAAASLKHPNIVPVHEVGVHQGQHYLVMDYVGGQTLAKLSGGQPFPPHRAAAFMKKIAEAVHFAHEHGVLHRDLKPSNVLVDLNDEPHVTDFGLAKRLDVDSELTLSGQVIGSPSYMAPEQARGKRGKTGRYSDVYSLGAILFHLLTGRPPFVAETITDTIRLVLEREPITPRTLVTGIPKDLDTICLKCLEKESAKRYATARELAEELDRFLNNEPIHARHASRAEKLWRWCRRKPTVATLSGATAISILAVAIGSPIAAWQISRERKHALQNAYSADMLLAFQALGNESLGRLRTLVDKYRPGAPGNLGSAASELRDWEWRYLWQQCQGDDSFALPTNWNFGLVLTVALADGRTVVVASHGALEFWDIAKRTESQSLSFPDYPASLALSRDGHFLLAAGWLGCWSLWDVLTRQLLVSRTNDVKYLGSSGINGVAFSPDGSGWAVANSESVQLWSFADLTRPRTNFQHESTDWCNPVAFSPDGRKLAYIFPQGVRVHDMLTWSDDDLITRSRPAASALTFLPGSSQIACGDFNGQITIWDTGTHQALKQVASHLVQVQQLKLSPDGSLLASAGSDQTIRIWDTRDWHEVARLHGHENRVSSVAFLPDGKRLVSSGGDGTVRVWKVPVQELRDRVPVSLTCYLPSHPTSSCQIAVPGDLQQWQSMTRLDLNRLEERAGQLVPAALRSATSFAVDSAASLAAAGQRDGLVELWNLEPVQKIRTIAPGPTAATNLALGREGRLLAVVRTDGTAELWDLEQNRRIETLAPLSEPLDDSEHGLSFWARDRCLARLTRFTRRCPESLELYLIPEREHRKIAYTQEGSLDDFAISEDGQLLATSCWGSLELWEIHFGRRLARITGQLLGFSSLAFSPDGLRLVAAGGDGTITFWDTRTYQQVAHWRAHQAECNRVWFVENGRTLASLGANGEKQERAWEVRLWRAPTWQEIETAERVKY